MADSGNHQEEILPVPDHREADMDGPLALNFQAEIPKIVVIRGNEVRRLPQHIAGQRLAAPHVPMAHALGGALQELHQAEYHLVGEPATGHKLGIGGRAIPASPPDLTGGGTVADKAHDSLLREETPAAASWSSGAVPNDQRQGEKELDVTGEGS
jgi:hypothetical protein